MSDFALLHYANPFAHRLTRSAVSIVLEGGGRFEEEGHRVFVDASELVVSSQARAGTEAYSPFGCPSGNGKATFLFVDWDPTLFGGEFESFDSIRLTPVDRARLATFAAALEGEEMTQVMRAAAEIVALLRASGLPIRFSLDDLVKLSGGALEDEQRLMNALDLHLSNLEAHPSLDEVADELGWSERHTNRRVATLLKQHEIPWEQWRSMLHGARLISVFRVLSLPGATTELAAKKAGFRSAAALCHTLAKAGLPSPGALAKACGQQSERLDAWTEIVDRAAAPESRRSRKAS